jgi:hypothetical protein
MVLGDLSLIQSFILPDLLINPDFCRRELSFPELVEVVDDRIRPVQSNECLSQYIYGLQTSEDEFFRQIQQGHLNRIQSIAHYYKKRKPRRNKGAESLTM